nr:hypothetical protein BaRGS_002839 [Batillaria attramentaria]
MKQHSDHEQQKADQDDMESDLVPDNDIYQQPVIMQSLASEYGLHALPDISKSESKLADNEEEQQLDQDDMDSDEVAQCPEQQVDAQSERGADFSESCVNLVKHDDSLNSCTEQQLQYTAADKDAIVLVRQKAAREVGTEVTATKTTPVSDLVSQCPDLSAVHLEPIAVDGRMYNRITGAGGVRVAFQERQQNVQSLPMSRASLLFSQEVDMRSHRYQFFSRRIHPLRNMPKSSSSEENCAKDGKEKQTELRRVQFIDLAEFNTMHIC